MIKPGLYPLSKPRSTESHAELKVYEALARELPKGWYAWHSLRIRVPGHPDAEADFVIVDPPRGILIIEVKGGRIEERDGLWFSNGIQLKRAPREQALRFMKELLLLFDSKRIDRPPCGVATCFADTEFNLAPGQGDLTGCVLGAQDLNWLKEALPKVMEQALPQGHKAGGRWIDAIHRLWGEVWVPQMDFGLKARLEKDERIRLDAEQFEVIAGLSENRSVLVAGAAGTGKTVLALELARRLAQRGKRVLLLCYTEPLARWLDDQLHAENPAVWAIKRYAVELMRRAGVEVAVQETPEFWRGLVGRAVLEALPKYRPCWDAVVVDEGQDLIPDDWVLIEELCRDRLLWAFWDPDQAFWPDRGVREDLFKARYRLQKSYRCPEMVRVLAECYHGRAPDPEMLRQGCGQGFVAVRPCPAAGTIPERIATEIDKLKGGGLEASDVAVLSLRGATDPGSMVHRSRIGGHRVVRADDPEAGSNVVVETFLRFKGLERPAIVITDLASALDKPDYAKRMYISLTRALSTAVILDTREAIHRDKVLAPLITSPATRHDSHTR